MKIKEFYELVELQKEPEATLLPNLQYRTTKFPFFQPDIFIYIKCLYLSSSEDFADELTRLAPFVSDRKALFYYVMNDQYKQFQKEVEKKLTSDRTDMLINAFFETMDDMESKLEYENLISGPAMASSDYFSYLESLNDNTTLPPILQDKKAHLVSPDIDSLETDFEIITNAVPANNIDELETGDDDIPTLKHQDIIDRFLEKTADEESFRITFEPAGDYFSEEELDDMEPESSVEELENDYFFTQSLAKIYIKQKKYERAYEIIKHLSLNYPEKNIYFADQLSFLEKLIKNMNKNK